MAYVEAENASPEGRPGLRGTGPTWNSRVQGLRGRHNGSRRSENLFSSAGQTDTQRDDISVDLVKAKGVHIFCELWQYACPDVHHLRGLRYPAGIGVAISVLVRMCVVVKFLRQRVHQCEVPGLIQVQRLPLVHSLPLKLSELPVQRFFIPTCCTEQHRVPS